MNRRPSPVERGARDPLHRILSLGYWTTVALVKMPTAPFVAEYDPAVAGL